MIDGVYPSQLAEVEAMRTSHYRNLQRIINKNSKSNTKKISFMSPDFLKMSRSKKTNHSNWRCFTENKKQEHRFKINSNIYDKLKKIQSSKSRYAFRTEPSTPKDPLLHHNYLYECQRRFDKIQENNFRIASKLENAKGELSYRKQQVDFKINKMNVCRLQKFQRYKRLSRLINKSLSQKFANTTNILSNSSVFTRNFGTNPQNSNKSLKIDKSQKINTLQLEV